MTTLSVSTKTLDRASNLAGELSNILSHTYFNAPANDQLQLPLGLEQACEAFVEEREEFQATIAGLRAEAAASNAAFSQIAQFANALQTALNAIGIAYTADPTTGSPLIEIDPARMYQGLQGLAYGAAPIDL